MGKIKINKINESEIEVFLDNDVPFAMVENLSKSLEAKGLVQDNMRSSLGKRYFVRAGYNDATEEVHEKLMKSLEDMIKADPHTKMKWEQQRQKRLHTRNARRSDMGLAPISMDQLQNPAGATPPPIPKPKPVTSSGPKLPGTSHNPLINPGFNYTKKADDDHIENDPKCACTKCSSDRKANLNKSLHDKLKGNKAWGQHHSFPSAHQPGSNRPAETGEQVMANQLADMMMKKNMMKPIAGVPLLGSVVPPQPTNEQLFGHLVPNEEMIKSAERQYANGMNDFFAEAMKPLSSRFKSEEEELAYWSSLRVNEKAGSVE